MSHGSVCSWWGATPSAHRVFTARAASHTSEAARAKCTYSVVQMCKRNIMVKEAQRITGQDNQKKSLLLNTSWRSKFDFFFFFSLDQIPPLQMSRVLATNRISPIKVRLNLILCFLPGRLHSPETSSVFNFLSRSATRFPRILQGAHMSIKWMFCLFVFCGSRSVCKRSPDGGATCWCASGAG